MSTHKRQRAKVSGLCIIAIESIDRELQEMIHFFVSNHGLKLPAEHLEATGHRYRTEILKLLGRINRDDTDSDPYDDECGIQTTRHHLMTYADCRGSKAVKTERPMYSQVVTEHRYPGPVTAKANPSPYISCLEPCIQTI